MVFSLPLMCTAQKVRYLPTTWESQVQSLCQDSMTKSLTVSSVSPSVCDEVMGPDAMILLFLMLSIKPTFSLSSFTFIKRFFCHKGGVTCISEVIDNPNPKTYREATYRETYRAFQI